MTVRTAGHVGRNAVVRACVVASALYPGCRKQRHWRCLNLFVLTNQSSVAAVFGSLVPAQQTCVMEATKNARQSENRGSRSCIYHSPGTRHTSCADHTTASQTSH